MLRIQCLGPKFAPLFKLLQLAESPIAARKLLAMLALPFFLCAHAIFADIDGAFFAFLRQDERIAVPKKVGSRLKVFLGRHPPVLFVVHDLRLHELVMDFANLRLTARVADLCFASSHRKTQNHENADGK
jgi:hypothetical protein